AGLGGTARRAELIEELDVGHGVALPLVGDIVFVEDGLDRADGLTRTAVHALVGLDVEHPGALVDTVDRTFLHTGAVEHIHAWFSDHVRHCREPPCLICHGPVQARPKARRLYSGRVPRPCDEAVRRRGHHAPATDYAAPQSGECVRVRPAPRGAPVSRPVSAHPAVVGGALAGGPADAGADLTQFGHRL